MLCSMNGSLLVLEASGMESSAALWVDGVLTDSRAWGSENRNSADMFEPLGALLASLGSGTLDVILVGSGPGSYGGVRAALAAADGIALVHGADVVSLCSWESIALGQEKVWVVSDARRNGWATAFFVNGRLEGEIRIVEGAEMPQWLSEKRDSGVALLSVESETVIEKAGFSALLASRVPTAEGLGRSWLERTAEERLLLTGIRAEPIYVRAPHITAAKRPAWMIERGN